MSVQVKRRREAAAFLAGYVGAQGELLVDTTNNRVQVHDGATAGGWPAAGIGDLAGRNVVVNGNFAINQRAYASATALAAGTYAHDRWKAGSGGCTYTFSQTVPDTVATITAGTLVQAVEASNVYATAYWLTWQGTAQARVWQGAASGIFGAGVVAKAGGLSVNGLLVTGLLPGTIAAIEFTTGTLGLVQFEAALPNAGPTRFERRHVGQELFLCMRYFRSIGGTAFYKFGFGFGNGAGVPVGLIGFYVPMRIVPTVSTVGTFTLQGGSAYGTINSIIFDQGDANGISINVNVSGNSASGFYLMQDGGYGQGRIILSAEI